MTVTVASYAAMLADPPRCSDPLSVWYLGSDYGRLRVLEERIGASVKLADVAGHVNAAAKKLLPLIVDLDGALARPDFDRAAWIASDLADRSRYNSPFFLELARVFAVLQGVRKGGCHLLIADDPAFALTLYDAMQANGENPGWIGGPRLLARLHSAAHVLMKQCRRVLGDLRAAFRMRAQVTRLRDASPRKADGIRDVQVWITVWATDKTFIPDAPLRHEDRVGRLPEILRSAGIKTGYLVFPLWPERLSEIALNALRCEEPVLMAEEAVTLPDIVSAAWNTVRPLRGVAKVLSWDGFDLSAVLHRALRHENFTGRPFRARLMQSLPARLAGMGAAPLSIVTTYENHSWEKVLTAAVRDKLRGTAVVGYNHASFSTFYVSLNPSPGDVAANVIPDCVLTLGQLAVDDLTARGFPKGRLAVAGGLRFEKFIAEARELPPAAARPKVVLCCIGVDADEALELVHKGAQAVAGSHEFSLLVNFHPMSGPQFRSDLKRELARRNTPDFDRIRFDDRPVRALLAEVHAVLYIDSNAALEAAATGRRTIYVLRETGLDYDKMPPGLSQHCRTAEQIRDALAAPFDAARGEALIRRCISPVDEAVILNALTRRAA